MKHGKNPTARQKKLIEKIEYERERVKAYEEVVKIYGVYISLLLQRLDASKQKPVTISKSEIAEGLEKLAARAVPKESGFDLYFEEI